MNTMMIRWLSASALTAASLAGCAEPPRAPLPRPSIASQAALVRASATILAQATPATPPPQPAAWTVDAQKASAKVRAGEPAKLRIKRLVLAEGIKNREPVGAGASFLASKSDRIYAFLEVENASLTDGEVTVAFVPPGGGAAIGNVTLEVGPHPRWRTWAFTRGARKVGRWTAVVRSESGDVLARETFDVADAPPASPAPAPAAPPSIAPAPTAPPSIAPAPGPTPRA